MRKRRLGLVMGLGVALAMSVSACGVAPGPVQFAAGGPAVMQPVITGWQALAGTQPRATAHAMAHAQNLIAPELQLTGEGVGTHYCHELP